MCGLAHGGCLPFDFVDAWDNATARLTQMVPCPGKKPLPLASGTTRADAELLGLLTTVTVLLCQRA